MANSQSKKESYEISIGLGLIKRYVSFTYKYYYSEYIVVGKENIPKDTPIIFAPNHLNALMDALAVHTIVPNNLPVTFLARSDIFKNKKAARILNFMCIMPAFRMRDGVENLGKNNIVFDKCVEILKHNKAIGIMPEGNQGEERRLRPLVKGIFRIAFAAQQQYGVSPAVKIIPIGLDFGDLEKFGKHVIITIGKPIEVAEYMNRFDENPVLATNEIKDRLQQDLSAITLDLSSEKFYSTYLRVCDIAESDIVTKYFDADTTYNRFLARQKIAIRLKELEQTNPDLMPVFKENSNQYYFLLKKIGVRSSNLQQNTPTLLYIIIEGLMLLLASPLFISGLLFNILPFTLPVIIRKAMKVEYEGFFSSIQYVLGILLFPLFYLIQSVLLWRISGSAWWTMVLFAVAQFMLGNWAYQWYSKAKSWWVSLKVRKLNKKPSADWILAKELHKKIVQLIGL